jgi:hypothetical protein
MRWEKRQTGDWRLFDAEGEIAGAVVWQDLGQGRVWNSVSARLAHGPEEGKLTECKRRLERLWDEAGKA